MTGRELLKYLQAYVKKHQLEDAEVAISSLDDDGNSKEWFIINSLGVTTSYDEDCDELFNIFLT